VVTFNIKVIVDTCKHNGGTRNEPSRGRYRAHIVQNVSVIQDNLAVLFRGVMLTGVLVSLSHPG
jgi:hypothetical protein